MNKWTYDIHPKLAESIMEMASDDRGTHKGMPFYAFTLMGFNFHETDKIPTAGVNVSTRGLHYHYNPKFLDKLPPAQIAFLNIHELMHILLNHPKRGASSAYNKELANVAMDMIINQSIVDDIMGGNLSVNYLKSGIEMISEEIEIDNGKTEKRNTAWLIPKDYKGEYIFEELYAWLWKEYKKHQQKQQQKQQQQVNNQNNNQQQGGQQQQDGNNEGEGSEGQQGNNGWKNNGNYGKNDINGHGNYSLDTLFNGLENQEQMTIDAHMDDECSEEMKKQIVEDMIQKAKNRGLMSNDQEMLLNKLRPVRKNYLSLIKKAISSQLFGSQKVETIRKPNRRGIEGLKGNKKISFAINVILDTSGSMYGSFEKALAYIYQSEVSINLIQCDTQVHCKSNIKSKADFNKLKINGLGGTVLQPAIDFIVENKMDKLNTLILTDGYTDSLAFSKLRGKVLILSVGENCPITNGAEKVKQIIVEKEKGE